MNQSVAILRFLGIKYGYYPKEHKDAYNCDKIMSTLDDFPDVTKFDFEPPSD